MYLIELYWRRTKYTFISFVMAKHVYCELLVTLSEGSLELAVTSGVGLKCLNFSILLYISDASIVIVKVLFKITSSPDCISGSAYLALSLSEFTEKHVSISAEFEQKFVHTAQLTRIQRNRGTALDRHRFKEKKTGLPCRKKSWKTTFALAHVFSKRPNLHSENTINVSSCLHAIKKRQVVFNTRTATLVFFFVILILWCLQKNVCAIPILANFRLKCVRFWVNVS